MRPNCKTSGQTMQTPDHFDMLHAWNRGRPLTRRKKSVECPGWSGFVHSLEAEKGPAGWGVCVVRSYHLLAPTKSLRANLIHFAGDRVPPLTTGPTSVCARDVIRPTQKTVQKTAFVGFHKTPFRGPWAGEGWSRLARPNGGASFPPSTRQGPTPTMTHR